jgi:hypothetical protein
LTNQSPKPAQIFWRRKIFELNQQKTIITNSGVPRGKTSENLPVKGIWKKYATPSLIDSVA